MYKAIIITVLALGIASAKVVDLDKCASDFYMSVSDPINKTFDIVHDCTKNCAHQIAALEAEIADYWVGGNAELHEHLVAIATCKDDVVCSETVIQEMSATARRTIQEHRAIVKRHLQALAKNYPDESYCAGKALSHLGTEVHILGMDFFACVRPL